MFLLLWAVLLYQSVNADCNCSVVLLMVAKQSHTAFVVHKPYNIVVNSVRMQIRCAFLMVLVSYWIYIGIVCEVVCCELRCVVACVFSLTQIIDGNRLEWCC